MLLITNIRYLINKKNFCPLDFSFRHELIDILHLEMSEQDVLNRLRKLERADLIKKGNADIELKGLNDGKLSRGAFPKSRTLIDDH